MAFHKNLRRARMLTCKTQSQVANDMDISNAALSNYETGYREPDLETLRRLAAYYQISTDVLLDLEMDDDVERFDLWALTKDKTVRFFGAEYELKEGQRQELRRLLTSFFKKYGQPKD